MSQYHLAGGPPAPHKSRSLREFCQGQLVPLPVLYKSPRSLVIVRKYGQPSFRNRLRVVLLAARDGLQREQIERHSPDYVDVRAGRNQVGNVTGGQTATGHDYGLHVGGVSGKGFD